MCGTAVDKYIHTILLSIDKLYGSSKRTIAIIACLFLIHLFLRTGEICPGNLDENYVLARIGKLISVCKLFSTGLCSQVILLPSNLAYFITKYRYLRKKIDSC